MSIVLNIETEVKMPLVQYQGKIIAVNGSRAKEYSYEYSNPFPAEMKDEKLPIDNFNIIGADKLSDDILSLLKWKVYLNITSEDSKKENNKILSSEKVDNKLGNALLGWII